MLWTRPGRQRQRSGVYRIRSERGEISPDRKRCETKRARPIWWVFFCLELI